MINRTDYKSAEGVLNGDAAFSGHVVPQPGDGQVHPLKSGTDPAKDFINGKSAMLYNGPGPRSTPARSSATTPCSCRYRIWTGPQDRRRVLAVGCVDELRQRCWRAGVPEVLRADKYVASVATATTNIPTTAAAAATVKGYEAGGENEVFRTYSEKFALLRPVTPGYPFIATEFTKTAQDILNGSDPKQSLDQAAKNIDANQESNNYFE